MTGLGGKFKRKGELVSTLSFLQILVFKRHYVPAREPAPPGTIFLNHLVFSLPFAKQYKKERFVKLEGLLKSEKLKSIDRESAAAKKEEK